MRLIRYECEGGPLQGQTICVAEGVKQYKTQGMVSCSGKIAFEYYKYLLNAERNVFIYTGKG